MTDWYYHDPVEGRVGPLSAEDLLNRFRERRIQRDTLVWHLGLREWQPLERMAVEIGLDQIQPDATKPPPLPSSGPAAPVPSASTIPTTANRVVPTGRYSRTPLRPKKTLSTGTIVLILVAVLAIPTLLVLGSVTLSSYRDYAQRADNVGAISGLSIGLKRLVGDYALQTGRCPGNDDPRVARMRSEILHRTSTRVNFATIEGGCAFEIAISADGKSIDGKTLRYEGWPDGDAFAWECSGGDMPEAYRPYECRSN